MRVIKIIFKIMALFLLVTILTATYLLIYLDEHKGLLEYSASKALGREIQIEHGVALNWSLNPLITLKGLRVANPDWTSEKYLIDAESVVLQLDLTQLLHHLTIENVTLQNAEIFLETATDGRRNWIFGDGSASGIDIQINMLQVETSYLHYVSSKGVSHPVEITHLELLDVSASEFTIKTEFTYRDVPISISAILGQDKTSYSNGWPFKGQLTTGNAIMDFSGHMKSLLEFSELSVEFHSDRLDLPQALLTMWPSLPARQVSAQLKTKGSTPKLLLRNLSGKLKIGSSHLTLPAKNKGLAKVATLTGTSISIEPNQPVQLKTKLMYEEQSFQLEFTTGRIAELFFVDNPWKVMKMKVHTQLDKKRLEIAGTFGPLSAALSGRNLDIDLVTHYDGMKAQFNGKIARFNDFEGSQIVITASGPDLSRLKPWMGVDLSENPPFTFTALLKGNRHRLELKALKAMIRESDIAGTLSLPLIQGERIEGTLKSSTMDLRPFLSTYHDIVDGTQVKLLEQELPLDTLDELNGTFRFEVGRLLIGDVKIDDVELDATLDKGHLKLTMIAGGERLSTHVDLKSEDKQWRLSLHHKGKLNIAWLLKKEKKSNEGPTPKRIGC